MTTIHAQRIRSISRVLAAACLLMTLALPIALAAYWLLADAGQLALRANLPTQAIQAPLLLWQRIAGALVTGIPLSLLLIGLWYARACFKLFGQGQVFTAAAVRCLRRFAGWVAVSVAASMLAGVALSVLLTVHNPPGMRHLALAIGSDQIFTLFFAGMVWLMASVIGQGQSLAEENASFV